MDGHVHLGLAHGVSFALTLIVVMAVLRIGTIVLTASDIPIFERIGKALAFIL